MPSTETVKLLWNGDEEPDPFAGVEEVLEAGKFVAFLQESYETDGVLLQGDVQEAYVEEGTAHVEEGETVTTGNIVLVDSYNPSATENAAINGPGKYFPATDYRLKTPV